MKILFIVSVACILLAGCSSGNPTVSQSQDRVTSSSPVYEKLAALEESSSSPSDATVNLFKSALASLSKKCWKDSSQAISDYIVTSRDMLKKKGVDKRLSAIARAVDASIPTGTQVAKCSEVFALFVSSTSK